MALRTTVDFKLIANYEKTAIAGNTPLDPLNLTKRIDLTSGTGAGQADKLYYAERTINASSSEDLDISGSLSDNFGVTFTIARVKAIAIIAEPSAVGATANTNNVLVGNASANAWATLLNSAGVITLRPGAGIVAFAGAADATAYAVTGGTGDLLKVANSGAGTSVTYQIYIVAASA